MLSALFAIGTAAAWYMCAISVEEEAQKLWGMASIGSMFLAMLCLVPGSRSSRSVEHTHYHTRVHHHHEAEHIYHDK